MSKAPKAKKSAIHYQPYQATGASDGDEPSMDLGMTDLPLQLDPVLAGLSSNMSRNLWDDWNENDANFGMQIDVLTDEVGAASIPSSMADPHQQMHESSFSGYEQQIASPKMVHMHENSEVATLGETQKLRLNVQRSLSEDIVNMLDDHNGATISKQLDGDQRGHAAIQNLAFQPEQNVINPQQRQPYLDQQPLNHVQLLQHQQLQMQQHLQQQVQQHRQNFQQETAGLYGSNFIDSCGGGNQTSATTNASASGTSSNPPVHERQSTSSNSVNFSHDYRMSSTLQHVPSSSENEKTTAQRPPASLAGSISADIAMKTDNVKTASSSSFETKSNDPSQLPNSFGFQGMMINPFLMYPMMGAQGMNMMGMPLQMPVGMNVNANAMNGANATNNPNGLSGIPFAMQMQLQLQFQLQMAQMAQMNGMGVSGMHMPVNFSGFPMGLNMQMPFTVNTQQQVNPQSGQASDVAMTSVLPMGMPLMGGAMLNQTRQPQEVDGGGHGFVSIARKPERPEVSSILKSLMKEEAKKKEKKLERNRDSARESRKKQQTYVETLENGIKRLQLNWDLVRSYQWGVSGSRLGPLPCTNSPQMFDWKNAVEIVTGKIEDCENFQHPANFQSLIRLNRQRRILAMQHEARKRAVWKCFVSIGRQLAAMRTRVLQVQMLRSLSENALAMELDALLNLTADQKLQLRCHAEQMFSQEVLELTKLFKIFFALRNEALRLNMISPLLDHYFRETCSFDQMQNLLQWTETHHTVIETGLALDIV